MAIEYRRQQQLGGTAADWTSLNPTLLENEIGVETDTGKWKLGPGAWNSLPYQPTPAHTHPQSDITGLVSALAGKAASSHTHAASDIASGTIATARLGSGTANSTTVLHGDSVWRVPAGGGGGGLADPFGAVLDVRDDHGAGFGVVVGSTQGVNNSKAIQACFDLAATQSGGWGARKILFPATEIQHDGMIDLAWPCWFHAASSEIQGAGPYNTMLRCDGGPAIVVAKHPRRWHVGKTSYVDTDTSLTVNTTGTVSGETQLTNIAQYKPDLIEFRTGGDYEPGAGRAQFAPTISPSQYFAVRSRGVIEVRFPYHPFAHGDAAQTTLSCTSWPNHTNVTWEVIHHNHQTSVYGGIAGAGGINAPDPWILWGDGTNYILDLAMTDANAIRRTWIRCEFPQTTTTGIHRVCIQFEPNHATVADRIIAFVDGTRVAIEVKSMHGFVGQGPYYPLNSNAPSTSDLTNLWTVWNRIAPWQNSEFHLFGETAKIGGSALDANLRTDFSILAMSIYAKKIYNTATVGGAQTKLGGSTPADDATVWAWNAGNDADATNLGFVACPSNKSPNDDLHANINVYATARGRLPVWGCICPKGNLFDAVKNITIRDIGIRATTGAPASCGIYLGPVLDMIRLENLDPANAGYFASIGSMDTYVSYYLKLRKIKANRMIHLNNVTSDAETIDFGYCLRSALRLGISEFRLRDFQYPGINAQTEGFSVGGASLTFEDFTINSEEKHLAPWQALIVMSRFPDWGSHSLTIMRGNIGTFGGNFIRLDDFNGSYDARKHEISIDSVRGIMAGPIIQVVGPNWTGEIGVGPENYLNEMIAYESPVNGPSFVDIKTVDRKGYGIPPCGGFVHNCHEVRPKKVPEGGVSLWKSWRPANTTATYYQGSNDPPEWLAAEISNSNRNPNAMSANIPPGIHAVCTLPWPDGANPTTILHSGMTAAFSRLALATILAGASAPTRTHLAMKWGYNSAYTPLLTDYPAGYFALPPTTNSGKWAAASARSKATTTNLTVEGMNVDAWLVNVRRRWFGSLNIGGASNPMAAFVFQTNVREPAHWVVTASDQPVISAGNLILRRPNVPGWTTYAANKIIDWIVDGTLGLGGPWYFGLSRTEINPDDASGITEPSGGNYARVEVAMTTANWGEWFDSGFYVNKTPIEFNPATSDWGDLTHFFISDAPTLGNVLAAGPLNKPIRVTNGSKRATFYQGAFQVQL